jgi:N-acetyl-anhydromuramyl-L-alanine amidase AmpD
MRLSTTGYSKGFYLAASFLTLVLLMVPTPANTYPRKDVVQFQRSIVDYRSRLNPRFQKIKRQKTKYIIVHTAELGRQTTLRVVSQGKRFRNGRRTPGGHAHYVVARDGRTYRILDKQYVADHAGISMWDGDTDISRMSIGIELVGYHYAAITDAQYRSVGLLIDILQEAYGLDDRAVLTHSQVA